MNVSIMNVDIFDLLFIFLSGSNFLEFVIFISGNRNIIVILAIIIKIPPILLGIDRSIQYANKKYHSGIMWIGVIIGFAGMKFSGSISTVGFVEIIKVKIISVKMIEFKSL